MNERLVNRIRQCPDLPSLPSIAIQVLDLAQRAEIDITEIARLISKDPALSGKILRTVNSSFYARSQHVSTVSHALVILGLQSVKALVLGFSLVTNLTRRKPGGFQHLAYWKHSIFAATAARGIAARVGIVQQEEAFLAALLMDIGMLVLDQVLGEPYGEVHALAKTHEELAAVEAERLGMSHVEVAAVLVEQWKLPPLLAVPIGHHDDPSRVEDEALRQMTEVAHLAGRCADVFTDEHPAAAIAAVRSLAARCFQMSDADADALLDEIGKRTREVAGLFEINIGAGADYEAILAKADAALTEIAEQRQRQKAERHGERAATSAVGATSPVDALTGLPDRASFDQFLAEQFRLAVAGDRPVAVLVVDVDQLREVNEEHGRAAGDALLATVGKLLRAAARKDDLAARYGGPEMALALPNTGRGGAASIAETIRRAIAARPFTCAPNVQVPVTASLGVAVYEPGSPLKLPAQLMKAAGLAVYNAKLSGRNCVRVFSVPTPGAAATANASVA